VEVNAAIIGQFLGRSGEIKARGRRDGPSSVSILRKPSALAGCRTSSPRSRTNRLWLAGFRPLRPLDPRGQARKSRQPSAAHAAHHAYPANQQRNSRHTSECAGTKQLISLCPQNRRTLMTSHAVEGACAFAWRNYLLVHKGVNDVRGPHIFSRWEWPQDSGAW